MVKKVFYFIATLLFLSLICLCIGQYASNNNYARTIQQANEQYAEAIRLQQESIRTVEELRRENTLQQSRIDGLTKLVGSLEARHREDAERIARLQELFTNIGAILQGARNEVTESDRLIRESIQILVEIGERFTLETGSKEAGM